MDAFITHKQVISEYKNYLESFLNISDERIKKEVKKAFDEEGFIPQPLIQFNPSFKRDQTLSDLVNEGRVEKDLPKAFGDFKLYKHQIKAIKKGVSDKGFVVTSGTGSGKSLTYLATIFNHVMSFGSSKPSGIKAILVYPMNALLNSQYEEITKYAEQFGDDFPVTFKKYSSQESEEIRKDIKNNPPDILLTNYMMLELIMTRQRENWLRNSLSNSLRYLVFDELHTYRGRQGSDVSMLIRRIKTLSKNKLLCIGTSATMASEGSVEEKKNAVAQVAQTIFGEEYSVDQIINEYLEPCTNGKTPAVNELKDYILSNPVYDGDEAKFISNPLSNWLETEIALKWNGEFLERGKPKTINSISEELVDYTEIPFETAKENLIELLKWTERLNEDNRLRRTRKTFLPFRFHQFISQTSTVSVTLEPREERYITIKSNRYVKINNEEKLLFPVLFSRYSGIDFICVEKNIEEGVLIPRNPNLPVDTLTKSDAKGDKLSEDNFNNGYIVLDEGEEFWQDDPLEIVPESWLKKTKTISGLEPYYEMHMPKPIYINTNGHYSDKPKAGYLKGYYIPVKLRIDPTAGIIYEDSKTNENTKLMSLGNEGRSTATTITSLAVINSLFEQGEEIEDQKLLSFTDNRQDASLQAGHFNDYISTIRLRAALYKTVKQYGEELKIENIAERVISVLNLKEIDYANPNYLSSDPDFPELDNERALKVYVLYRLFQDLKRGWRYTLPNLEQTALLKIEYFRLDQLASLDSKFEGIQLFDKASAEERYEMLEQLLNYFRTNFSLYDTILVDRRSEMESLVHNRLSSNKLWSLDHDEKIDSPTYLVITSPGRVRQRGIYHASIGSQSGLGKYFRRKFSEAGLDKPDTKSFVEFMNKVATLLVSTGFLTKKEDIKGENGIVTGYLLRTDIILWKVGDEITVPIDKVRTNAYKNLDLKPNQYFQDLYKRDFAQYKKEIIAREHTGQLNNDSRIDREEKFRSGEISSLFCSPTMELGIDISNLNIVHMRNVPPSPSNYAQRSGRAGRGGQTALVFTYCSGWSPHDQNYFNASESMVAGTVVPPRIDLINEELIASHLNAVILMELSIEELNKSIGDLLDINNEIKLELKENIKNSIIHGIEINKEKWIIQFKEIVASMEDKLASVWWYSDDWISRQIDTFLYRFDSAFNRWRKLYKTAKEMNAKAHINLNAPHATKDNQNYKDAKRQYHLALKQIELLTNKGNKEFGGDSEFYVFRYLASEGFLPGYNFTRLPVRTFLGYKYRDEGEYISRPRSVAISEFGPNNTIYHNGSKYSIQKMPILESEEFRQKAKISNSTGYIFLNQDAEIANNDPITKEELISSNYDYTTNLVELMDSEGVPRERISCVEEERISRGFQIQEYFRYPSGIENTKQLTLVSIGDPLINIIFGQATEIIKINRKARRSAEDNEGFAIDKRNGKWLSKRELENEEIANNKKDIMLFVRENADTIYIQPLESLGLNAEEVISLSYALKRGIEQLFQVEEQEIGVSIMGNEEFPNLMIYEASEGSLGILSQLIEEPQKLKELFIQSYKAMHFDPETNEETEYGQKIPKATYEDLLSYYNQRHHAILDRLSIKEALERLINCDVNMIKEGKDYASQYRYLLNSYDSTSETELRFLKYLFNNKLALPDKAQIAVPGCYLSADFIYNTGNGTVLIFCDGSVHDSSMAKEKDAEKRNCARDEGYDVIEWHYIEPLDNLVERRKDIFRKVG